MLLAVAIVTAMKSFYAGAAAALLLACLKATFGAELPRGLPALLVPRHAKTDPPETQT